MLGKRSLARYEFHWKWLWKSLFFSFTPAKSANIYICIFCSSRTLLHRLSFSLIKRKRCCWDCKILSKQRSTYLYNEKTGSFSTCKLYRIFLSLAKKWLWKKLIFELTPAKKCKYLHLSKYIVDINQDLFLFK